MTHDLRVHNNNIIHFITEIHFTVYRSKKNLFAGILLCCKGFPISIRKQIKPVMKGNYLIFKIFKKRNFLQWKRLNIDKLVLQSCLDLIERSVYREPNPRTENSPSPPMTTKTSQVMIANGLAELSFPLTQTPFLTQSCHLPTHCQAWSWAICWHQAPSKTTKPTPPQPPNFVFQLPCLPVIPIHKVLNWLLLIIYYHLSNYNVLTALLWVILISPSI